MTNIADTTTRIAREILVARQKAHEKHGDKSIEMGQSWDRFNSILVEEIGEVSKTLNELELGSYDNPDEFLANLRSELIDSATVIFAWISQIDEF